jgi:hypothetical protein
MAGEGRMQNIKVPYLTLLKGSTPDTPDVDTVRLFVDTADDKAKLVDEADNVLELGGSEITFALYETPQQITANNSWETLTGTTLSFTAAKDKYHIQATFTYGFTRDGFWEIALMRITGTNTGTISPTQWDLESNQGDVYAGTRRMTRVLSFIIEPTVGASVSLNLQCNNSNTSNYLTYDRILMEAF